MRSPFSKERRKRFIKKRFIVLTEFNIHVEMKLFRRKMQMSERGFVKHEDHCLDFVISDRGVKLQARKIHRELKQPGRGWCLCNDGCNWLYFLVLSAPANWPSFFPITLALNYTLCNVKKTHCSRYCCLSQMCDGKVDRRTLAWIALLMFQLHFRTARQNSCISSNLRNTCASLRR